MNESPPSRVISVRAIEDIMQIQRFVDITPGSKGAKEKNTEEEGIVLSVLKHDVRPRDSPLNSIHKKCDIENTFTCTRKTCKRLDENNEWETEGCQFPKFVTPDVVLLENFGIIENAKSEGDVKCCWSSDSDITVLRVRKEYRNELSNRVEWEEQRNLEDEASISSADLDWESHSLINLANVTSKKESRETLTPFTIWSRSKNDTRNSSMIFMSEVNSSGVTSSMPEVRLAVEGDVSTKEKGRKRSKRRKSKMIGRLIRSTFACFARKDGSPEGEKGEKCREEEV